MLILYEIQIGHDKLKTVEQKGIKISDTFSLDHVHIKILKTP